MSTHAAPTSAGAQSRGPCSAAGRRRPPSDSASRLRRLSDRLDLLLRDVEFGATSQREHERHVGEAEAIAEGLVAIFRRPSTPDPVNPPRWSNGRGQASW